MIVTLLKQNIRACIKPMLILFAVICLYTSVIIYMYNPELSEMLNGYQEALPEMMSAVGMTGIATNLLEWIQIYLYGFIMNIFPMVFAIIMVNQVLMRYIDRGSIAGILSTPHSRVRIIVTQAVSAMLLMLLLLAAVTAVGVFCCETVFPGELDIAGYLKLNAGAALLQLLVLAIAFLSACVCSESKYYYTFGAGIPILEFLLLMLSNMGDKLKNLKYFTIYSLFPGDKIVSGGDGYLPNLLAMAGIAIVLYVAGILWFRKRDLSV